MNSDLVELSSGAGAGPVGDGAAPAGALLAATGGSSELLQPAAGAFVPPVPATLADTGLGPTLIEQLILKTVYLRGDMIGRDISRVLGLQFCIIESLLDYLKRRRLVEVKGSLGIGDVSSVFAVSEAGRNRARECLEDNQYSGAAPVPITQYTEAVRRQRWRRGWLSRQALERAFRHMVVTPESLSRLGPALNAGKSFLLYGRSGNGKTYLAEALAEVDESPIFIPWAIECEGRIIKLLDPVHHRRVAGSEQSDPMLVPEMAHDQRWVRCRRPFIVTGGELTMNMLDLAYNAVSQVYDAPAQLKANNGIYLIDDFGRQKASPAEVLNRWIVPMDRRVDYLTFHTGGKVEVPFETLLVFSTNLKPEDLGDEAFMRRIDYKIYVDDPTRAEFEEIFRRFCASQAVDCPTDLATRFVEQHYLRAGKPFRRCHPRDVITHALDLIQFERSPQSLTVELLEHAFESCFAEESKPTLRAAAAAGSQ